MACILMVAEKPSFAESLAKILSNGKMRTRKGLNGACSVHEFRGPFQGNPNCLFKFTSVCGHVMTLDFNSKYNDWNKTEPIELFDALVHKKETNPKLKMSLFLRQEAKNCDKLVLWLDCDKEGENICFEIMSIVCASMKISFSNPQTVFRAKFSAITERDIKYAFKNLVLPNELESLCVDARQEIDLKVGCSFTRQQTKFFHEKYGDLDSALISYGPCQTPTLGFCVERHDKILNFEPEPYYVLDVSVKSEKNDHTINLQWQREREFSRNLANQYLNHVKNKLIAKVVSVNNSTKTKTRPQALNTVDLLKVASSAFGIGPHQAMQIAERLYTQGYISYPRTETNQYSKNFDLKGTLKIQENHPVLGEYVKKLLSSDFNKPRNGHDAGDHPPITPMRIGYEKDFDKDSWRIYDFITRNFISSVSPDLVYKNISVGFEIGNEKFFKSGNKVIKPGFTEIIHWQTMQNDLYLPDDLNIGNQFQVIDSKLNEKFTTPPPYLSESDLISLMEKNGIGTDASIPQHINNICTRNYVKVTSDRRLIPTQLGIVLVHGYQRIDPELILPTSRANVEKRINQICTGDRVYRSVLEQTVSEYKDKFKFFLKNINLMDELFQVSFSTLADTGKPFSKCGICRRYLKFITHKPQRLYCQVCAQTFSLPQNGTIKTFKDDKCPLDNFALLQFNSISNDKTYVFCPQCFNNPPYPDMSKASPCIACTDKNCNKAMIKNLVRICLKCKYDGRVVLESWSGPSRWKFICTKCNFIIYGFKDAHTVKVLNDEYCKNCSAWLVKAIFKEKELIGCIFCDKPLLAMLNEKLPPTKNNNNNNKSISNSKNNDNRRNNVKTNQKQNNQGKKGLSNNLSRDPNDSEEDFKFNGRGRGRGKGRGRGRGRGFSRGRGRGGFHDDETAQYKTSSFPSKITLADFMNF